MKELGIPEPQNKFMYKIEYKTGERERERAGVLRKTALTLPHIKTTIL